MHIGQEPYRESKSMRLLALVISFTTLVSGSVVYRQPAVGDGGYDSAVVLLRDGLSPLVSWDGLSDLAREEFWSLGFMGMQIQRSAWAGYIIVAPEGSTDKLLEISSSLADVEQMPDTSMLGMTLQMTPVSACSSTLILFSDSFESFEAPESLPLRRSMWLSAGTDTIIAAGSWSNSVFLLTVPDEPEDIALMSWRGIEYEAVPVLNGSATVLLTSAVGGTPSDVGNLSYQPHPCDSVFADPWIALIDVVDSIIRDIWPAVHTSSNLIWFRGMGSGNPITSWTASPSPPPPSDPRFRVDMPSLAGIPTGFSPPDYSEMPDIAGIDFPGSASSLEMGLITAGILERSIARDEELGTLFGGSFSITVNNDGALTLWFRDSTVQGVRTEIMDKIVERVAPLALSIPDEILVHNAAIRASVQLGYPLDDPEQVSVARELGSILGLL